MIITSKYSSTCRTCGGRITPGERIHWARGQGARHLRCPAEADPEPVHDHRNRAHLEDCERCQATASEIACARAARERDEAEYQQGRADAERYLDDVKTYGRELAEQWEMEAELARYNRGEDY